MVNKEKEEKLRNNLLKVIKNKGTKKELYDLCKSQGTSLPEQYIFSYFKQVFPNIERNKRLGWHPYTIEFDIYIPELKLAIEYDGVHYHERDTSEKYDIAKENNIEMIRIRERGLKLQSKNDILYDYVKDYSNIESAIKSILNFIHNRYENIKIKELEIDINKIKENTLANLREENINRSIRNSWPEITEYWDYEKNDNIIPEDVRPSNKLRFYCKCPYCGKDTSFVPHLSYAYYGKNSFIPEICDSWIRYCLEILKSKDVMKLDMNKLEDRRIRDFLVEVSKKMFYEVSTNKIVKELENMNIECNADWLIENNIADYYDYSKKTTKNILSDEQLNFYKMRKYYI